MYLLLVKIKKIIACIIFSRLIFDKSSINTFLLGPVAVDTNYQGIGIGKKLIEYEHNYLKQNNVEIVLTYGDINFYSKVGYKIISESILKALLKLSYPEGWLAKSLINNKIELISGNSHCVEAINKHEYW